MQVSAASSIGHNLAVASAMSEGRSQRVVSKETFGESRKPDTFSRSLDAQSSKPQVSTTYGLKKAQLTEQHSATAQGKAVASEIPVSADTGKTVKFTQDDIQSLLKLFGSSVGNDKSIAQFDLDGSGTIDLQDLSAMLNQISQSPQTVEEPPAQFTQADVDLLLEAFGSQIGDDAYSEALDLDGDGVIGLQDLSLMLNSLSEGNNAPENSPNSALDQLTAAFGLNQGDDGFLAELDLNNDGTINLSDLSAMLISMGQN